MCKELCPLHNKPCESDHEKGALIPTTEHWHVVRETIPPGKEKAFFCAWQDELKVDPDDDQIELSFFLPSLPMHGEHL
jgi:hypothetical protein